MIKRNQILNYQGYAVRVAGFLKDAPTGVALSVSDNDITIKVGSDLNVPEVIATLHSILLPAITEHNELRKIPKITGDLGSEITIFGEKCTVMWETLPSAILESVCAPYLDEDKKQVVIPMFRASATKAKKILMEFLEELIEPYARSRYNYWKRKTNLAASDVLFMQCKQAWASMLLPLNVLMVNPILATQDKEFINEVILHELLHIVHAEHNAEFYALLEKYMPNFREVTPLKIVPTLPLEESLL